MRVSPLFLTRVARIRSDLPACPCSTAWSDSPCPGKVRQSAHLSSSESGSESAQHQPRRGHVHHPADHDVEGDDDPVLGLVRGALLDAVRDVARPDQHAAPLGRRDEHVGIELILGAVAGLEVLRELARRSEDGRSAVLRRLDIDEAAQQAVRMNVHVVAAIRIGDICPHVGDVMRIAIDRVGVEDLPRLQQHHVDQFLHLRKGLDVVGCHVGEGRAFPRGSAFARALQLPQLLLDPVAHAEVRQPSREHRRREQHEHLLRGQLGRPGRARGRRVRSVEHCDGVLVWPTGQGSNMDQPMVSTNPLKWAGW